MKIKLVECLFLSCLLLQPDQQSAGSACKVRHTSLDYAGGFGKRRGNIIPHNSQFSKQGSSPKFTEDENSNVFFTMTSAVKTF